MAINIATSSQEKHSQNDSIQEDVVMVMVPFPAQGHLNQLLHLSRLVSSYNLPIHYVSFSTFITQAKRRVHGWDPLSGGVARNLAEGVQILIQDPNIPLAPLDPLTSTTRNNIHFKEFTIPSSHESPNRSNVSKLLASTLDLSLTLREPIRAYLNELSSKTRRLVIVYDSLMAWVVQDIVSITNAEAYCFHAVSAYTISSLIWESIEESLHIPTFLGKIVKKFLKIPQELPSIESCFTQELLDFVILQDKYNQNICSGNLLDTCKVVEGPFLETLVMLHRFLRRGKQWAIGPFNPIKTPKNSYDHRHDCLTWLDKQEPSSVILVSFGTTSSLSSEQIKELALGLEKSQQKLIWIVRDALLQDDENVKTPNGYEERVEGRGLVIKDWAPQLEILGHLSTGGFMSHCGWNSCMESITMGVPIAAWPMNYDQPRNAVLITKVLKIGLVVKDWESRDDLVNSTLVENAVRKLMDSSEGNEMRMKAMELGEKVRESMMDGGVSRMEMDSFIAHVTRD